MLSYLPAKYLIWARIGQNMSGIFVNLLRFLVTLIIGTEWELPDDEIKDIIIKVGCSFFLISGFINLLNVILVIVKLY